MNSADGTIQGKRIYQQKSEFLAPSHGCVIQNRAIMRYTLRFFAPTLRISVYNAEALL